MTNRRIIVDVDTGVDDYFALLLLFYAEKLDLLKIEAITCTSGNTSLDNVCKNTLRLLEILGRTDIPVFKGCDDQALVPHQRDLSLYFGVDGFGGLNVDFKSYIPVSEMPASVAIHDIVTKYKNEVSMICLGPLTNLALALRLYPDISSNLKDIWIMGGNYSDDGDSSVEPEFNFLTDPEAAYVVLKCAHCPIYLLPWQTCLKLSITMEWKNNALHCSKPAMELLSKAEKIVIDENEMHYLPCDAFLAFAFINPDKHIVRTASHCAIVEIHDISKRGQVILLENKTELNNVIFITDIDEELFKNFIVEIDQKL